MKTVSILRGFTAAAVAATALTAITTSADAGGFAVREQSALHQGASFAGSASGSDISTMYWNPAGVTVSDGTNSAAHNSLILGQTDITARDFEAFGNSVGTNGNTLAHPNPFNSGDESGNIASPALVGSSYANHQLGAMQNIYLGVSLNAPFGLVTQPDNRDYAGSVTGRTAKVFNLVGTPTVGVKVMPGVAVAAGLQIAYMDAKLKFGGATPGFNSNIFFQGDDYGVGWTVGIMLDPMPGTRIGLGYRSEIEYELEGKFGDNVTNSRFSAETELTTPDIVTISITQAISPTIRVMGTFEWTQWSDFDQLDIVAKQGGVITALAAGGGGTLPTAGISQAGQIFASLPTDWDDAWFASIGAEMDIGGGMTLRTGVAYEESPIQRATQRITAAPDNDRIWLSGGLSWALNPAIGIDLSYTHIFIDDAPIHRDLISNNNVAFIGEVESSVDIISFGFNYKMGAEGDPLAGLF